MVSGAKRLGNLISKFERGGEARDSRERSTTQRKRLTPRSKKKQITPESLKIGDKITLLDSPWKDCNGMYWCKNIRRPDFAESAMVAFAGAYGALTVSQSSKQFLMIIERQIVEFTKLNQTTGRVAFVSSVDDLYKMRLRQKDGLIALYFETAPNDPMIYKCSESKVVSQLIRSSKGSGMARREAIHRALHLVQEIQAQERALEYQPSRKRVNEIESLYEKAAQQFFIAEDDRHEEVVEHKLRFLALPLVMSIMNGTCRASKAQPKREPEILEGSSEELDSQAINRMDSDDISALSGSWEQLGKHQEDKTFDESVDDILFEARQDFEHLHVNEGDRNGDFFDRDRVAEGVTSEITDDEIRVEISFADLDAMMKAADDELEEILNI